MEGGFPQTGDIICKNHCEHAHRILHFSKILKEKIGKKKATSISI